MSKSFDKNPRDDESDNNFIKLMEYPSKDVTKNIEIYLPSQDSVQIDESELEINEDELLAELKKQNFQIKDMIDSKQSECEKNYNKAETVSLMTKYQMIFVKIEIYLTNFSTIIQNWNYRLARIAFNNIKQKYHKQHYRNFIKSSMIVLKVRRPLMLIKKIFDTKALAQKSLAFEKISEIRKNEELKRAFRIKFEKEINSLKGFLFSKKEEMDSAVKAYDDSRVYLQKSRKSNPNIISSTKIKSGEESFKLATTDAKKVHKKVSKGRELNKKLKISLKATEDKVHSFILDVNDMIDNQADLFVKDERFNEIFRDFWTTKENRESGENFYSTKSKSIKKK